MALSKTTWYRTVIKSVIIYLKFTCSSMFKSNKRRFNNYIFSLTLNLDTIFYFFIISEFSIKPTCDPRTDPRDHDLGHDLRLVTIDIGVWLCGLHLNKTCTTLSTPTVRRRNTSSQSLKRSKVSP
jgi:hypothetical protein